MDLDGCCWNPAAAAATAAAAAMDWVDRDFSTYDGCKEYQEDATADGAKHESEIWVGKVEKHKGVFGKFGHMEGVSFCKSY